MKILIILIFVVSYSFCLGFVEYKTDNGNLIGFLINNKNWEESRTLHPPFPAKLLKIKIYFGGNIPAQDTIWICYDPTDGYLPPSLFSHHISAYSSLIIDYDGVEGWKEYDVSDLNIEFGGLNGIVVQHVIKQDGPYFGIDTQFQAKDSLNSYLNNVYKANPNFYNIRGTIYSYAPGHYMVRAIIDYLNKDKNGDYLKQQKDKLVSSATQSGVKLSNESPVISEIASFADFNNDNWEDIIIKSNFFQNNGDGTFSKIDIIAPNNGTVWADVDNDGYIDFFVANAWGNDKIYFGNADGSFVEETDNIIKVNAPTVSPLWLDYDSDGLVDLYIAYGRKEENGQETYYQDKLFKNLGNRKFKEVTQEAGIAAGESTPLDCWGATVTDYNSDGMPDIFVATYRLAPDLLFKNNGNGTFTEVGASTGARGVPTYYSNYFGHGMGADWGDFDNDLDLDLAIGNLSHIDDRALASNKSLILRNQGTPLFNFIDATDEMRLGFFEMNAGIMWADLNLDGYLDLVHAQYAYYKKGDGTTKNTRFYLNSGKESNYKLIDKTFDFGAYVHGAWSPIRGDVDNDGDMDIMVASSNDEVKLFNNQISKSGNWVAFRLVGSPINHVNRDAYGSAITIYCGENKFYRALPGSQLNARASQSSNEFNFGLGNNLIDSVIVVFPDKKVLKFFNIAVNAKYILYWDGKLDTIKTKIPQLKSPSNDEILSNSMANLYWYSPHNSDTFNIQIAKNSIAGKDIILDREINSNSFEFNLSESDGVIYSWRVRVKEGDLYQPWSDEWEFSINTNVSIKQSKTLSDGFYIDYVSPLPASEFLEVVYHINNLSEIDISIIDINGKMRQSKIIKPFNTGIQTDKVLTNDFENGVYFLQIGNGKYIIGRKFIIEK